MFSDKTIDFDEFMIELNRRIQGAGPSDVLAFFQCFLREELPRQLKRRVQHDWDGKVNAGDFDAIYPMAANILHAAATRESSEANQGIYVTASIVSQTFCDLLNETFECSGDDVFDLLEIKSYSEMMAEAGLANLSPGPDGKTMISLTVDGERVAQEVGRIIKGPLN